jgi:hypothetical protein
VQLHFYCPFMPSWHAQSYYTLFLILLSLLAQIPGVAILWVPVICLRWWDGLAFGIVFTNMFPGFCLVAVPTQKTTYKFSLALQIRNKTKHDATKHKMFPNIDNWIKSYDKFWIYSCATCICLWKHKNGNLTTSENSTCACIHTLMQK